MSINEGILDSLPNLLIITDHFGRVMMVNRLGLLHLEKLEEDVLGKYLPDLFENRLKIRFDNYFKILLEDINSFKNSKPERFIAEQNGYDVFWQISLLQNNKLNNTKFVTILGSNTKELQRSVQSELMESSRLAAIATLSGGVAHEMNNPLAIIKLYLERVMINENLPKNTYNLLSKVDNAVDRVAKIVATLRSFTADSTAETWTNLDIKEILNRVISFFEKKISQDLIKVELDFKGKEAYFIGDYNHFSRMFECVFSNSIDALNSRLDQKNYDKKIKITLNSTDKDLCIQVKDNGIGMTDNIKKRIFDPFFTTKEVGKGPGLGLSIVYHLVDIYSGKITVKSIEQQGTNVLLSFPRDIS